MQYVANPSQATLEKARQRAARRILKRTTREIADVLGCTMRMAMEIRNEARAVVREAERRALEQDLFLAGVENPGDRPHVGCGDPDCGCCDCLDCAKPTDLEDLL